MNVDLEEDPYALNRIMQFDRVVMVRGGEVSYIGIREPDLYNGQLSFHHAQPSWTLLDGWSGQYGYSGPIMHPSEFIGGDMARHILATNGLYVALGDYNDDGMEGWAVASAPLSDIPPYRCLDDIERRNAALGHFWFSRDTTQFFRSIISATIYPVAGADGGAFFVSSERQDEKYPRLYTVRFADIDGSITTVSAFQQYRSSSGAHAAAARFASNYPRRGQS